jgi:hypothetical protein
VRGSQLGLDEGPPHSSDLILGGSTAAVETPIFGGFILWFPRPRRALRESSLTGWASFVGIVAIHFILTTLVRWLGSYFYYDDRMIRPRLAATGKPHRNDDRIAEPCPAAEGDDSDRQPASGD